MPRIQVRVLVTPGHDNVRAREGSHLIPSGLCATSILVHHAVRIIQDYDNLVSEQRPEGGFTRGIHRVVNRRSGKVNHAGMGRFWHGHLDIRGGGVIIETRIVLRGVGWRCIVVAVKEAVS